MKNYIYDMIGAFYAGVKEHPQIDMENLGYKVIKAVPVAIADCWCFRVENEIENTPSYLDEKEDDFKFPDELKN